MKFRTPARKYALVATVIAAPLALAACSDSDDAAYETDTETVEIDPWSPAQLRPSIPKLPPPPRPRVSRPCRMKATMPPPPPLRRWMR